MKIVAILALLSVAVEKYINTVHDFINRNRCP
jgi:hypothetical protein